MLKWPHLKRAQKNVGAVAQLCVGANTRLPIGTPAATIRTGDKVGPWA